MTVLLSFISAISIGEGGLIMNTMVIGGAGFIGSNLCERLLNEGHEVFCLDDLSLGNEENLNELTGKEDFHFIRSPVA